MEFYTLTTLLIFIGLITAGILLTMYLNGNFTYTDKIIEQNKYSRTVINHFGGTTQSYVYRVLIKRTYDSGKIKFISREVNI